MVRAAPILVVEDSQEDFETIAEAARKAKVSLELVHARDAFEAAAFLGMEGAKRQRFSLVILDYNLPGKNGRELLREFARFPERHLTPVVFYTTSTNMEECRECFAAGANAFHTKSVRYNECLDTLHSIFDYWLHDVVLPTAGESVK